jgi:hypothetical protein
MGVGAVFISSLALTRLPIPHDPPQNQQEHLAATLQPIVSFIVLGSIIIRKIVNTDSLLDDKADANHQMVYLSHSLPSDVKFRSLQLSLQHVLVENVLIGF